jgi:Uma2 family endonuclease
MATTLPTEKVSFEAFLAWADEDVRAEWVDGEVEIMSPVGEPHQDLCVFLLTIFNLYVRFHRLGRWFEQTFVMKLGEGGPGREPDLLFVSAEHQDRIHKTYLEGPADLVIEIVSPESQDRDRETKRQEYERGGVREYWLLDPEANEAIFYQLQPNGVYTASAVEADGIYRSAVIVGLWIDVDWLWQRPLPDPFDILRQWGLITQYGLI